MSYAGYGLFRGLNEAYDSYRDRESDIAAEENAAKERAYQEELRAREKESYEYGLQQRPQMERKRELEMEGLERQNRMGEADYTINYSPEALEIKKQAIRQDNQQRILNLTKAGLDITTAGIQTRQAQLSSQYTDWAQKINSGEWGLEELKKAYNTDNFESNDVEDFTENEDGSVTVTYSSGQKETYKGGRDEIFQMLRENANPAFAENVILKEMDHRNALNVAHAKASTVTTEDMQKRALEFMKGSERHVKAVYGRMFPNGIMAFGEEGQGRMAQAVESMMNRLARHYDYDLTRITPAQMGTMLSNLAEKTMDFNPEVQMKRAREQIDVMTDVDVADYGLETVPKKGTPEYKALVKQLVSEQGLSDLNAFEAEAVAHMFGGVDENGKLMPRKRPKDQGGDQEIPKTGLPGQEAGPSTDEIASQQLIDDPESGYGLEDRGTIGVGEGFAAVLQGLLSGNQGKAPALKKMEDEIAKGLPRKKKRQLQQAATTSYNKVYPTLSGQQKAGWLNTYGKFLSRRDFNEARKQVPKAYRDSVTEYAGI
jgi:hypothetical protein